MASLAAACRISARLASSRAAARGFTTSARCLAAQNFVMPALSPTMTEGNIASWKVKKGDSFSAGDVLLEIETDKATMDVEAQEDGVMMKIFSQDGSKAVQVGTRIAVLADAGDDINSLELPADEQPKQSAQSASPVETPAPRQDDLSASAKSSQGQRLASSGTHEHKYPLLPSVGQLVREHGLSKEDVSKIRGTGPSGRLLKGDVLAFLGAINPDRPAAVSSHLEKLAHLDLSNIKVAEKKAAPAPKQVEAVPKAYVPEKVEIKIPVSFEKVIEVQNRIQDSLDIFLPLSTFISRATMVANDDLPAASRPPAADELFDQVLGLDKIKATKGSRGFYLPQVSAIVPPSTPAPRSSKPKTDLIDILAGPAKKPSAKAAIRAVPGLSSGVNVFSLVVPKEEKERAQVFLERCRLILEDEPGRLVL